MTTLRRRDVLLAAAAALPLARAGAQAAPLRVVSHRVHKTVATGTQGGDATAAFTRDSGSAVEWNTFDTGPLQERLLREAALLESSFDVGFILNTMATPRSAVLFEPLDAIIAKEPIEDAGDVFPGLMQGMSIGKACTYKRADGTPCVGLVVPGVSYPNVIDIARAWDGDFITPEFKVVADQPAMLNAIRLLRELFQAGAFPRGFAALGPEDVNTWIQQGRAAITLTSMGRNRIYNDPQKSKFAGRIMTGAVPISATLKSRYAVAPAKVEFWGMVIPRNSKRKDLAWRFMKSMLTREATLQMALNGNGPVRASTYDDANLRATVPYADAERAVLKVARVPLPAFDEAARAGDIFKEEAEAAVLGMKTPEAAMAAVVQRVKPLLPA